MTPIQEDMEDLKKRLERIETYLLEVMKQSAKCQHIRLRRQEGPQNTIHTEGGTFNQLECMDCNQVIWANLDVRTG